MSAPTDLDLVRAFVDGRLGAAAREAFAARLDAEPALAELVARYGEVAAWPEPLVAETAVRPEDLPLDVPAPQASAPGVARRVAIAAVAVLAIGAGAVALARRTPSEGPLALEAIRDPLADAGPLASPIPALAASYVPVVASRVQFIDEFEAARRVARLAERPTFVYLHYPGCPVCAEFESTTLRDARTLGATDAYVLAKVDARRIPPELAPLLEKLEGWPLFVVIDATGASVDSFGGPVAAEALAARLEKDAASGRANAPGWTAVHTAVRALRAADAATMPAAKLAALDGVGSFEPSSPIAIAARARREAVGREAGETFAAARSAFASSGPTGALGVLDAGLARFAGTPFERDLRRVRDRLASGRLFPSVEHVR